MRKFILTLFVFTLGTVAYSQKTLREKITTEQGVSKHFVSLTEAEQIAFNPQQARSALDLNSASELIMMKAHPDAYGYTHYRYYQTYKSIPIENSMYIVHVKAGKLTGMSGEIVTEFDRSMDDAMAINIAAINAINIAIKHVNANLYAWQDAEMEQSLKLEKGNRNASYYPTPQLAWFNEGDNIDPRALRLAYKIDVYARQPLSRAYYFIDVQTGQFLGKKDEIFYGDATGTANTAYSGTQTIHSDLFGTSYRLRDLIKGGGVLTLHGESGIKGTDYTSTSFDWNLTGTNQAAMDAHYGVSQTYAFYKTNFGRNSYDNLGTALKSYVNDPTYIDNAYWDGTSMYFCKRSNSATNPGGVTGIDVAGHELTHGVTQSESNLNYSKEPGAMNESMSDIFGKSVQFWSKQVAHNWVISNDMNWNIRNMGNPNQFSDPDTYKGQYWVTTSGDNYGVHSNSGVGNFMYYLLVEGGSGTNDIGKAYSVAGIGLDKAAQILYKSNTDYLTPTSQYADWRQACINAAGVLYPNDATVLASVQNAWYAVGVGPAAGTTTCNVPSGLTATNITTTSATLNWAATGATSYNLQWGTSTSGTLTTVLNIAGTSYNLSGLTANTSYKFLVQSVCGATTSSYSAATSFATLASGGSVTYCASKGNSTGYEYIKAVKLGTIDNMSNNNNGYGNYTSLSTNLTAGVANTITLTPGFVSSAYSEAWTIYIDYNQNGTFEAGETISAGASSTVINKSITVPVTTRNGPTRMRIQMKYGGATTNPCLVYTYGEVEDYTVNISGGTAINGLVERNSKSGISIRPNPVTGSFATVDYTTTKEGSVTLRITDAFGRLVQTISIGNQGAGTFIYNLNNRRLANGTYIMSIMQNKEVMGKTKFIVIR